MSDYLADLQEKITTRLSTAAFYADALLAHFRGLPNADQTGVMNQREGFYTATAVSALLDYAVDDIDRMIDRELSFEVTDDELHLLKKFGDKWGCSADAAASRLIREGLHNLLNRTTTP